MLDKVYEFFNLSILHKFTPKSAQTHDTRHRIFPDNIYLLTLR